MSEDLRVNIYVSNKYTHLDCRFNSLYCRF
nr:MAG TPA: hypothetical protein [Caudoviricetes sp.]DAW67775.1 MAG TPA: hypothetical protein [Caudoviricetes sp.]